MAKTTEMTKLQKMRISRRLTVRGLAIRAACLSEDFDPKHIELAIEYIESGISQCPKPRKTYEWKAIAKALNCDVTDIYE